MRSIFNGLYTLIFIRFIRAMFTKLAPYRDVDTTLPRYLILAMFCDRGMLLGYANDYSICKAYAKETTWSITITECDMCGRYSPVDKTACGFSDASRTYLTSLYEQDNPDSLSRDARLAERFGCRKEKIEYLTKRYLNGNYI